MEREAKSRCQGLPLSSIVSTTVKQHVLAGDRGGDHAEETSTETKDESDAKDLQSNCPEAFTAQRSGCMARYDDLGNKGNDMGWGYPCGALSRWQEDVHRHAGFGRLDPEEQDQVYMN